MVVCFRLSCFSSWLVVPSWMVGVEVFLWKFSVGFWVGWLGSGIFQLLVLSELAVFLVCWLLWKVF